MQREDPVAPRLRPGDRRPGEIPFTCGRQSLGDFLAHLDPGAPATVRVSGACTENVVISGFTRLTLLAAPGASISDASGGADYVLQVATSSTADVEGFIFTGGQGVVCQDGSTCTFVGNTFQGSAGDAVTVSRSYADVFFGEIRGSGGTGLVMVNGSVVRLFQVTINGHADIAAAALSGSNFTVFNSSFVNNGGDGIVVRERSAMRLFDSLVQQNAGDGILVDAASEAQLMGGDVVTANRGAGITLADLSFVRIRPDNTVAGNGAGIDLLCNPQFSATRGASTNLGGGITNCVEP
jgi:hypothetical protein